MNNKLLLFGLFLGIGVADYFLLRKSRNDIIQDIMKELSKESKNVQVDFLGKLNKMTRQELHDVYVAVSTIKENSKKTVFAKLDPAFVQRMQVISKKYNIFT